MKSEIPSGIIQRQVVSSTLALYAQLGDGMLLSDLTR